MARLVFLVLTTAVLLLVGILTMAGYFQLFAEPYVMTQGGPLNKTLSVSIYMYQQGFTFFHQGYASSIAYVLFLIVAAIAWLALPVLTRDVWLMFLFRRRHVGTEVTVNTVGKWATALIMLALALLKQNRAQDALAVYANLKVPSNAVSASAVAVHASVLASTGRKDEARAEIAKIPSNRLLPEEAMMVLPLRG